MICARALHREGNANLTLERPGALGANRSRQRRIGIQSWTLLFFVPVLAFAEGVPELPPSSAAQSTATIAAGSIQGTVLDASGASLSGAGVTLTDVRTGATYNTQTDAVGSYSFAALNAHEFRLAASAPGFDSFTIADIALASGQTLELSPIVMHVAVISSNVEVTATRREIAEAQMKSEQQQRIFGVLPNYYVVYFPDPVPLSAGQKMRLAFRLAIDPVNIGIDAAQAGLETNSENFKEYGTGAEGFGKRFAAAYVGDVSGTIIGSGILPALLRQDPRYYYKGTGTFTARMLYALSWSFRCKGDNGKWQLNYSSILGNLATTGISNLYLPEAIRSDGVQTLKYSLLSLASQGVSSVLQEFVFKRITSHANEPGKGSSDSSLNSPHH